MPDLSVVVDIWCNTCGAGLCNQTTSTRGDENALPSFRVDVCQKCMGIAEEKGYQRGLAEQR